MAGETNNHFHITLEYSAAKRLYLAVTSPPPSDLMAEFSDELSDMVSKSYEAYTELRTIRTNTNILYEIEMEEKARYFTNSLNYQLVK